MNRAFLVQLGIPVGVGFAAGSALPIAAAFNTALVIPAVLSLPVIGVGTLITGFVFGDRDEPSPTPFLLVTGAWMGLAVGGFIGLGIAAGRGVIAQHERNQQNAKDLKLCQAWEAKGRTVSIVIERFDGRTDSFKKPERECFKASEFREKVTAYEIPMPPSGVLKLTEKTKDCRRDYVEVTCDLVLEREDGSEFSDPYFGALPTETWRFGDA